MASTFVTLRSSDESRRFTNQLICLRVLRRRRTWIIVTSIDSTFIWLSDCIEQSVLAGVREKQYSHPRLERLKE